VVGAQRDLSPFFQLINIRTEHIIVGADMIIDTKTIQTAIDNHTEASANGDMDHVIELDTNMNKIRNIIDKIQYMSNTKASAVSELLLEAVEISNDYINIKN